MKCLLTGILSIVLLPAIAQTYVNSFQVKEATIGDRVPDISLGTIINGPAEKKRFSDFKDQLIILDFWNSYCSSCIAAFPKMEELQKRWGKKVKVILVNT